MRGKWIYNSWEGESIHVNMLVKAAGHENIAQNQFSLLGQIDFTGSILRMAEVDFVCTQSKAFGRVTLEGMLGKIASNLT